MRSQHRRVSELENRGLYSDEQIDAWLDRLTPDQLVELEWDLTDNLRGDGVSVPDPVTPRPCRNGRRRM